MHVDLGSTNAPKSSGQTHTHTHTEVEGWMHSMPTRMFVGVLFVFLLGDNDLYPKFWLKHRWPRKKGFQSGQWEWKWKTTERWSSKWKWELCLWGKRGKKNKDANFVDMDWYQWSHIFSWCVHFFFLADMKPKKMEDSDRIKRVKVKD